MPERDPEDLADQLEEEADRLQKESERLGEEVASTRKDWEQKRGDPGVPGARPGATESNGENARP